MCKTSTWQLTGDGNSYPWKNLSNMPKRFWGLWPEWQLMCFTPFSGNTRKSRIAFCRIVRNITFILCVKNVMETQLLTRVTDGRSCWRTAGLRRDVAATTDAKLAYFDGRVDCQPTPPHYPPHPTRIAHTHQREAPEMKKKTNKKNKNICQGNVNESIPEKIQLEFCFSSQYHKSKMTKFHSK